MSTAANPIDDVTPKVASASNVSRIFESYKTELVFDIETDASVDVRTAKVRYFGAYSYKTGQEYFYTYKEFNKIHELVDAHKVVIGHNIKEFDIPILANNDVHKFDYKVLVDTLKIARNKLNLMRDSNGEMVHTTRFSLDETYRKLFRGREDGKILGFDYKILTKDLEELTPVQLEMIKEYTMQDIRTTKAVFEEMAKQFWHLKEFLCIENRMKYKWLTRNMGSYSYGVFCNLLNLNEEYAGEASSMSEYEGGHVIPPREEELHDNVYILDYASQYPHNYMQFSLFSPCISCGKCSRGPFVGNDLFKVDGKYCTRELGTKEKLLKRLYLERKRYKDAGDERQLALKIVINSTYGITAKPVFKHMYYPYRASDCCKLGRQLIMYADYFFTKQGYIVAYGDTDSIMLKDPYADRNRLDNTIRKFITLLKKYMPFPQDTFTMGVEELSDIWFVKKKHYMYLSSKGKFVVKGLPIMQSSATELSRRLLKEYLTPEIMKTRSVKFPKSRIVEWIAGMLKNDITVAATTFNVREEGYDNDCLQSQILKKYGHGKQMLVKNKRLGVGKNVKYCSLDEARRLLKVYDIDLSTAFQELAPFTFDDYERKLTDFG